MATSNILSLKNLRVSFGKKGALQPALKGIDFDLRKGETLGIVGESGSGKSLTALSIMGLLPNSGVVESGEIYFYPNKESSINLLQLKEKAYRKLRGNEIGMIFQEPMISLNPVFTCGNQVVESLQLHKSLSKKEAKNLCLEWFEKVQLPRVEDIFKSYPHEISGGQKQRVMIAMALCCEPSILIADEPTTALDVTVQKRILELIKELQAENGTSVIFISHDLGVIGEICDRVNVMYKGDVVESGSAQQIFTSAKHPYSQGLLACRPRMEQQLNRLPTLQDFLMGDSNFKPILITETDQKDQLSRLKEQKSILEVTDLKTHFPIRGGLFSREKEVVKAVDGVSFEVFEGETLGLVGESGCGKTTLGRSILNLIKPTAGSIYWKGKSLLDLKPDEMRRQRKQLQMIFQDPYSSLNPRMTIGKAIQEPMEVHGIGSSHNERKAKTIDLLVKVGLEPEHYDRYPHQFSGGQRQRVSIARSLAVSPDFVVCDESVSALDVSVQAQVLNLLKDLQQEYKLTYIFISHDLSVVKFMSDRIMVMQNGKIVETAPSFEIYKKPKTPYTAELINAIPAGSWEEMIQARKKWQKA
ncbi:MAG: ABC transporter ATP-binding protein [Bacteroidia bacterium]|nr:ABC transporter ATP-binding protein [Bacteroidia bacterium]